MHILDIFDAARQGDSARVAALLEDAPDLACALNSDGELALHLAASGGHRRIAALLLDAGASVNARSRRGATPLTLGQSRGHVAVVQLLLARGANQANLDDVPHFAIEKTSAPTPDFPPTGDVFFVCSRPFAGFGARL